MTGIPKLGRIVPTGLFLTFSTSVYFDLYLDNDQVSQVRCFNRLTHRRS